VGEQRPRLRGVTGVRRRTRGASSHWGRIWPWLALAVVLPAIFGFGFILFGGWLVLPSPWSWISAAVVYGLVALAAMAERVRAGR
jgi:hypothetical protein